MTEAPVAPESWSRWRRAWLAWALCRNAGIGTPDWVASYLDRVASSIERLAVRTPKEPGTALAGALEMKTAGQSGRGTVFSFLVHHAPQLPGKELPATLALVELDEGVRMGGEVTAGGDVVIGDRVHAVFERIDDDLTLVQWAPVDGRSTR